MMPIMVSTVMIETIERFGFRYLTARNRGKGNFIVSPINSEGDSVKHPR